MTIEERLENVERELGRVKRRNHWLLGAVLLVAGALVVPAVLETTAFRARAQVAGTKEIRANNFVLVDENGKVRGQFSMDENVPRLRLFDENGIPRAGLGAPKDGPGMGLMDKNGHAQVGLLVRNDVPTLQVFDKNAQVRIELSLSKDGPGLWLYDEKAKIRAALGLMKNGPELTLADENGQGRLDAGAYPESSLILFGPDGKVIWSAIK